MSTLVDPSRIERIVGMKRRRQAHYGRAISGEQTVYILHSQRCLDSGIDLRNCRFSRALDLGIEHPYWTGAGDKPVVLGVWNGHLIPIKVMGADDAN